MSLTALPAFSDNDIRVIDEGRSAFATGPDEPGPRVSAIDRFGLALAAILVTHSRARTAAGRASGKALAALRTWKNELR